MNENQTISKFSKKDKFKYLIIRIDIKNLNHLQLPDLKGLNFYY